jgi:1,2-diacylglycerol 3-alpha-glucosyltransferase
VRILLTTPTYPPFNSGLGNAVAQQAAYLAKAGHDVVVATGGSIRSSQKVKDVVIETFMVRGADGWIQPISGEMQSYIDFICHDKWDVTVFNAWQNWATDLALRNLDNIHGRHFVYSHCISTNIFFAHQPFRSLLRYLAWRAYWWRLPQYMKRLDGIFFLANEGSDSRFDDLTLARKHKIPYRIIPNSISMSAMTAFENPANSIQLRDQIMAVGSYQWQKGFDFVLRAYAASEACQYLPLHLYGQEHSTYSAVLRNLSNELGLRENQVIFHEGISGESLVQAYCRSKLILSGSHTECQPLVLIDAIAAGTPFIARTTGCISGMPGGLAVSSVKEMTIAINTLIDESLIWETLADSGRKAVLDIYHPDRTIKLLLEAISEH